MIIPGWKCFPPLGPVQRADFDMPTSPFLSDRGRNSAWNLLTHLQKELTGDDRHPVLKDAMFYLVCLV